MELTLVYICKANLPDLSVFTERIQNSAWVYDLCIDLVQIALCQQSVLESILPVAETNIYNKTNITLSCGLYEDMK